MLCGTTLVVSQAAAQDATEQPAAAPSSGVQPAAEATAREQFEAGRTAYDGGDFEAALGHFEAAYQQSGRPRLLYNIGLAADRLRHDERALEAFRAYLASVPDAENRVEVENRIRALAPVVAEEAAAAQAAEQAAPASAQQAPPPEQAAQPRAESEPDHDSALPLGPIVVAGAGVALIGASVVFGLAAKSSEDEYANAPVTTRAEIDAANDKLDTAQSQATISNVTLGLGLAAVAGAAVWWFLDDGSERPVSAAVVPLREGAFVAVRGSWGMP